jgi:hypothetical protein
MSGLLRLGRSLAVTSRKRKALPTGGSPAPVTTPVVTPPPPPPPPPAGVGQLLFNLPVNSGLLVLLEDI